MSENVKERPTGEVRLKVMGEVKIDRKTFKKPEAEEKRDYVCYVINKSDFEITHVQIVSTGSEAPLVPTIKRTCSASENCQQCSNEGHYQPYLTREAGAPDIQVKLKARDSAGNVGYTDPLTVYSSSQSQYNGQVDCINQDG